METDPSGKRPTAVAKPFTSAKRPEPNDGTSGRIPVAPHSHSPEQKLFLAPYGTTLRPNAGSSQPR